nr:hypothetical protein REQ54_01112 [Rhizobium sp. Q54]
MTVVTKPVEQLAALEKIQRTIAEDSTISTILKTVETVNQTCAAFSPLSSTSSASRRFGNVYYASTTRMN